MNFSMQVIHIQPDKGKLSSFWLIISRENSTQGGLLMHDHSINNESLLKKKNKNKSLFPKYKEKTEKASLYPRSCSWSYSSDPGYSEQMLPKAIFAAAPKDSSQEYIPNSSSRIDKSAKTFVVCF